ncbi:TonB-dependent siderophore receptor [Candidatus Cyanaurora vandensis]|nr:TonB-dependent receptor plug domain-containing protein [Candidatus Cyanaurora vandensis]
MRFALFALGLLGMLPCLAQTPAQDFDDLTEADLLSDVTVTATRSRERVFYVPTPTTVITKSQALERTQTSLADLLKGEVGVFVRATNPSAGSPIIRGVTGRDVLMLVDGFRLSHAFMRPNTQYQGLVDSYFIEQIEVVRGPGSVLYGSDALGGITNTLTPIFQANGPRFQIHTDYTSNPAGVSTHGRVNLGDQDFNVQAGLTYRTFGDVVLGQAPNPQVFFPNPGRTVADSGYEFYGLNFKSAVQFTPSQSFTLTAQHSRIPTVSRQDGIIQGYGPNVPSAERGFAPQSRTFILGSYQADFEQTWLDTLRLQAGYQQIEDNRNQRNFSTRPSFPGYGTGTASSNNTL